MSMNSDNLSTENFHIIDVDDDVVFTIKFFKNTSSSPHVFVEFVLEKSIPTPELLVLSSLDFIGIFFCFSGTYSNFYKFNVRREYFSYMDFSEDLELFQFNGVLPDFILRYVSLVPNPFYFLNLCKSFPVEEIKMCGGDTSWSLRYDFDFTALALGLSNFLIK